MYNKTVPKNKNKMNESFFLFFFFTLDSVFLGQMNAQNISFIPRSYQVYTVVVDDDNDDENSSLSFYSMVVGGLFSLSLIHI